MAEDIRTVVFDFGGVLIDWNPRYVYREIFDGDEDRVEWFLTNICTPEWNARQDAGRSMEAATKALVARFPEHEEHIRAYYDRWEEMIGGAIEDTVEILRSVRDGPLGLYGLTNWSAECFPVALEMFDFLDWFEGIVVSGEVGLIKPNEEIYHHLVDTFDLSPSSTVFIDDSAANIETARALGFAGIHFTGADRLRSDLKKLGIELAAANNQ
ncbi:MAG: HAD family phosphatase [Rhodothermales bacterium]